MISVSEAKEIVKNNSGQVGSLFMLLREASNFVLSEDIYSPADIPFFDQSNMDGYAFAFQDHEKKIPLRIEAVVAAGQPDIPSLKAGQAARIFTGAPVPGKADTVVMQERTRIEDGNLIIEDGDLVKGNNVRPKGSDIRSGSLALPKGTVLSPSAIGFLAAMGIERVKVISRPKISILVTGKEVRQPGQPRNHSDIYDANSFMLTAALEALGIRNCDIVFVDDELPLVHHALEVAVANSDMVLLTGGISVGDFDFVLEATQLTGVQKLFHLVKQKPGKPLYFGKKGGVLVFGLPGNPSSVLSCFYEYVLLAIGNLIGRTNLLRKMHLPLGARFTKKSGLTHFLKGKISDGKAYPLDGQESYRLSTFAQADCLIYLEENGTHFEEGTIVEVHLLSI